MSLNRTRTSARVLYADVDPMRFAYYGRYAHWFEMGRAEFMRVRGLSYAEVEQRGCFLPVSEAYYKYHKPIRYDDRIWIEAWPDPIRKVSVRFNYRILNEAEETLATGYTVHFCMSGDGRMIRMPGFLLEVLTSESAGAPPCGTG